MTGVFISYRRDDTKGFAGALLRDLNQRIGMDKVFMDLEDILGGTDFPTVLEQAVRSSAVLLALIGPRWLGIQDAAGKPRLEDPNDFVRLELERALQADVRVIPVLVDGAAMPKAEQLPPSLRALATRNALELSNLRWEEDVARLADHVREGLYAAGLQGGAGVKLAADFDALPPMAPKVRIAVTVAIVLGLLFGGIGLTLGVVEWRQGQRAVRTEGEVVELRQQAASRPAPTQGGATLTITDSGGGGLQYLPVVTFVTPQGQRQSFVSKIATNPPAYRVGV